MLTASAIDRIRESIEAELGPRSMNIAAALNSCDSEFARAGAFNSSRRILQRGFVACQWNGSGRSPFFGFECS